MKEIDNDDILEAIFRSFPGYIYICSQDYQIQYMNRRLIERTGRDATGESCHRALHGREEKCSWCVNEEVFRGETMEWEIQSPLDSRVFRVTNTPITNTNGSRSKLALIIDITEYREAEEELFRERERFRTIVEDQTELICRFDGEGKILFVNTAYCSYFKKSSEDLTGSSFMPLIPEEDRHIVTQCIHDLNSERPVLTIEHRVFDAEGSIRWQQWTNRAIFDREGNIAEYQAVGRDITDRKDMELRFMEEHHQLEIQVAEQSAGLTRVIQWLDENIKQKEAVSSRLEILTRVLDASSETIVIISAQGIIEYVNERYTDTSGFGKEDMVGHALTDCLQTSMGELQEAREILVTEKKWEGLLSFKHRDGESFVLKSLVNTVTVKNQNEEQTYYIITSMSLPQK